ncbi:alpha/beta hydrolase [Nonomuraea sp. NPDC050310]|uniref:alpha/beta hydrolase n=1 Tax=unclassified Nonomuraea TaxID=2593643 RepID=UPI0033F577DA
MRIIVGADVAADAALLREIAEREFDALGVTGVWSEELDAGKGEALVLVPGPDPGTRAAMAELDPSAVWADFDRREDAPGIYGRGIEGLLWAIRRAVHLRRHAPQRIRYGGAPEQWAELHLPEGGGPHPVVALIHGGYWRSHWGADVMDALCADLARRGLAAWNLEYRGPDRYGWAATCADIAAGLAALAEAPAPLDLDRVAVAGHSAGGQLALCAAADGARVALAVSLAGVLDLAEGERRWLSSGAVRAALGALPYGEASPLHRVPLGVRQLIVQGSGDELDLVDFGRRYARAAKEAGDDVTHLEMSGDHFAVIDPRTPIWQTTAVAIARALR